MTTRYEMDGKGGLVPLEVPTNSRLNDLPAGTVLHWGGNQGWAPEDFVIIRRLGDPRENVSGVYYDTVSPTRYNEHRVESFSIKAEGDPKVWHSQHFFLTDRVVTRDEIVDLVEKSKAKKVADAATAEAKANAHTAEVARLRAERPDLLYLPAARPEAD